MPRNAILTLTAALMLAITPAAIAQETQPLYPGFPSIRESKAYKKFAVRPLSNLSKLLYLVDRFGESEIEIVYDNQTYKASFANTVVRWFLARNYKKQTPEEWIQKWGSYTIGSNKLIYAKLPNGEFRIAKEILMEEMALLEQTLRENQMNVQSIAVSEAPLAKGNTNTNALVQALAGPKPKL